MQTVLRQGSRVEASAWQSPRLWSDPLEELRDRVQAGERVTLADLAKAAGWSPVELHVVSERLKLRSYGDIARDPIIRARGGRTRQRMQQIEQLALRKVGTSRSVEEIVGVQQRHDAAIDLIERGHLTRAADFMRLDGVR